MLDEQEHIDEKITPQWIIDGAMDILKRLNYDIEGDVHQQFLDRHNLKRKEKKETRGRPKKDLPKE